MACDGNTELYRQVQRRTRASSTRHRVIVCDLFFLYLKYVCAGRVDGSRLVYTFLLSQNCDPLLRISNCRDVFVRTREYIFRYLAFAFSGEIEVNRRIARDVLFRGIPQYTLRDLVGFSSQQEH